MMTEPNEPTYAAVITISLPGADKAVNLVVTLTPAAPVAVGNGRVKPLRDCTLAELQQFADAVEAGILA
ncbi:MAG: hypothetical protein L0332_14600, partial [Chloroflexi bacterium]|nr:hypothetical protein [Chloroflexota bacterium]MCI0727930.1 hypothetical protein [Chloroflexota bacterium]